MDGLLDGSPLLRGKLEDLPEEDSLVLWRILNLLQSACQKCVNMVCHVRNVTHEHVILRVSFNFNCNITCNVTEYMWFGQSLRQYRQHYVMLLYSAKITFVSAILPVTLRIQTPYKA